MWIRSVLLSGACRFVLMPRLSCAFLADFIDTCIQWKMKQRKIRMRSGCLRSARAIRWVSRLTLVAETLNRWRRRRRRAPLVAFVL